MTFKVTTLLTVSLWLLSAAALPSYIPVRRAARVDSTVALRLD